MGNLMPETMSTNLNCLCSIVIPVYAESDHFAQSFTTINKIVESVQNSYEFVIVDDGSPDSTWDVVQKLAKHYPSIIKAVRLSRNFGKESALCAGLELASGEAVIIMDGDLQHPPELIPKMLYIWQKSDVDIVEAIKISRGKESVTGKIGAKLFYAILNYLSGYNLKGASDFKLLDRKVVNAWLQMGERNLFFRGMTAWLGFQRVTIPFEVPSRIGGQSGWSTLKLIKLAITGITAFSSLPLHLITFFGCIFLIFAVVLGSQAFFLKFTGRAVDGFTTVIILLLIIGSLLMISLGIIGLYIARIYEEVKGRPRYIIAEKIDIN
jgi:polyisoprenyl-phosphate glycosyltransferase